MNFQAMRGLLLVLMITMYGAGAHAAQYAALVMDARTGKVLHSENADTRLHPASLTKMMTLYLVFTEIRAGRMTAETKVTISRHAASQPPSKLGLKTGQEIELKYLIRAAAVKSANDAASALAEAVSGSEEAFARRMTSTAQAMGMSSTTFKNPHGLTSSGHLSTARDMALLGRRLFYDFPEYYNLFSRRSTNAKVKTVYNTNRRLLDAYSGADGIKTGYTRAAGFNLVSSAKRGQERVIVSVFGGTSTAARNAKVAELMDLGFRKMPSYAQTNKPGRLRLNAPSKALVASNTNAQPSIARRAGALRTSGRPKARPLARPSTEDAVLLATAVDQALQAVGTKAATDPVLPVEDIVAERSPAAFAIVLPRPRPSDLPVPKTITVVKEPEAPKVARAVQESGKFIVELGGQHTRGDAERLLLTTALQEMEALEGSQRHLAPAGSKGWYKAQFVGLSAQAAETACARLAARQTACEVVQGG
ncbi:D-alanyl-D-alanine carboxypeptidase family protein [Algicella marina]|uniref:D-alanyl-D-alanine carboxypeptidase n=1 Tax=Algicella marina TaxID=2683284 RepID=A0A6P1SVJ0_9RHOB|nr:D-alanyl-D-alanine carboxypeptidase family protein [Algicella marina]QHQ33787.1 D-alanyl-D-alanine carboxypeptidase [Algicella marina]